MDSGDVRVLHRLGETSGPASSLGTSFTPDASRVVTWSQADQSGAVAYDVSAGRLTRLRLVRRNAQSLGFVAVPDGVLQRWSDGALTRYDAAGRAVQSLDAHDAPVLDAVVLRGGGRGVTVGAGGEVRLWAISSLDGEWTGLESLPGHSG